MRLVASELVYDQRGPGFLRVAALVVEIRATEFLPTGIWTGQGDGQHWNDSANWSNGVIPGATTNAFIDVPGEATVLVDDARSARSLVSEEALTIAGSGALSLTQTSRLSNLTITGNGRLTVAINGTRVIRTSQLVMSATATLDLTDNDLIVDYTATSNIGVVQGLINSARAGGAWTGTGITSTAAKNANPRRTRRSARWKRRDFKSIYGAAPLFAGADDRRHRRCS